MRLKRVSERYGVVLGVVLTGAQHRVLRKLFVKDEDKGYATLHARAMTNSTRQRRVELDALAYKKVIAFSENVPLSRFLQVTAWDVELTNTGRLILENALKGG